MTFRDKKHRFSCFLVCILTAIIAPLSADPFNNKLSTDERSKLLQGEVVIRNTGSLSNICMKKTPQTEKMLSIIEDLKPAYLAEIIQVRPYKGNENLDTLTESILSDIPSYAGIPYYSVQAQKWFDLYSSAAITKTTGTEAQKTIFANLEMSVFGTVQMQVDIQHSGSTLFYRMKNTNKLRYHDQFTAIQPENMQSIITVFRDGDNWILYAIGGVDAYKIFFLKERIETSFLNRIKTFCNFVFTKIDSKEG